MSLSDQRFFLERHPGKNIKLYNICIVLKLTPVLVMIAVALVNIIVISFLIVKIYIPRFFEQCPFIVMFKRKTTPCQIFL